MNGMLKILSALFVASMLVCVENSVEGADWGDTIGTAKPISIRGRWNNSMGAGDIDWARITVPRAGQVFILTTGSSDTYGQLHNSGGGLIVANDDGGSDNNCRIARALPAGTYYIKIRHYSSSSSGSYSLVLMYRPGEPNSSRGQATYISMNSRQAAAINPKHDLDFYRYVLTSYTNYKTYSGGYTDTVGSVLNGNGAVLYTDDDSGVRSNFDIWGTSVPPGTYYVKVQSYGRARSGTYTMNLWRR